ncbi:uncharacterized protein LOC135426547 isoform X1 [Drosophila montana]|uniref:uncharacterized protein LOC135426547 isoform X1 n=1 Tax=Drosophila montana TaxID=40370 RepID=UPI00313E2D70
MYSNTQHLALICPYMMTRYTVRQQLTDGQYNGRPGVWHHDARNCLIVAFYCEREVQAEVKIFNLLMRSSRKTESIDFEKNRPRGSTDAEVIFGDCDCEKMLCDGDLCKCGWDKSRIDWLWELERRQQSWLNESQRSTPPTAQRVKRPVREPQNNIGCWKWLRLNCGCVSDTESFDLPYRSSTCL